MTLKNWLKKGDFTLSLSAGFFGFYAHCGFTQALWDEGFKPKRITGTSAGAVVGACLASDIKPVTLKQILVSTGREDFWDPSRIGLLKGERLQGLLEKHLPQRFENLSTPLAISAFDILKFKNQILTSGDLPTAVRASCCFPLLFKPVKIQESYFWDGGLTDKIGFAGVKSDERTLLHYLHADGISSAIEKKWYERRYSENHKVVLLKNSFAIGPHNLDRASEAIDIYYQQAKILLSL